MLIFLVHIKTQRMDNSSLWLQFIQDERRVKERAVLFDSDYMTYSSPYRVKQMLDG